MVYYCIKYLKKRLPDRVINITYSRFLGIVPTNQNLIINKNVISSKFKTTGSTV